MAGVCAADHLSDSYLNSAVYAHLLTYLLRIGMDISNSACLLVTSVRVFIGVRLSVRRVMQTPPDAALYDEPLTELCLYVNKTGTKR